MPNRVLSEGGWKMDIRTIYDRQYERVYRVAMLYLKKPSDAEDVVQNVFIKYIERPVSFEDLEHEKAWFITVTRNKCKDVLKNFWRSRVDFIPVPERAADEDDGLDLSPYIMKLSPKYREVLYLYYYEEYPIKEMSQILKRNVSTIQTQLASARNKLKKILEEEGVAGYEEKF